MSIRQTDQQAQTPSDDKAEAEATPPTAVPPAVPAATKVPEFGGPPGPEPTRYGDWQFKGRVTDF